MIKYYLEYTYVSLNDNNCNNNFIFTRLVIKFIKI